VFDLRLKIEPTAAARACRAATPQDREAAKLAFEALDRALVEDSPDVSDRNRDFHLSLVRPSGRAFTTDLVERLHSLAERYVRAHLKPEGRSARARHEHRDLHDAWTAGRPHMVETMVRQHISGALDDLRRQLRT
jgi:DNA-binding GntR family transcriptional regulator